jgi:hypothetical protein
MITDLNLKSNVQISGLNLNRECDYKRRFRGREPKVTWWGEIYLQLII